MKQRVLSMHQLCWHADYQDDDDDDGVVVMEWLKRIKTGDTCDGDTWGADRRLFDSH